MPRHRQPKPELAQSLHEPAYSKVGSSLFMHVTTPRELYTVNRVIEKWAICKRWLKEQLTDRTEFGPICAISGGIPF